MRPRDPRGAHGLSSATCLLDAGPGRTGARKCCSSRRQCSRRSTARSSRAGSTPASPRAMIDVGNDREFGFLYRAPIELLDRTFAVAPGLRHVPPSRARRDPDFAASSSCSGRSKDPTIQVRLLAGAGRRGCRRSRSGERGRRGETRSRGGWRAIPASDRLPENAARGAREARPARARRDRPQSRAGGAAGDPGRHSQADGPRGGGLRSASRPGLARVQRR